MLDVRGEDQKLYYVVGFFGDNTKERITKPENNMFPWRCKDFLELMLKGAAHSYGGAFFLRSVELVVLREELW